MPFAFNAPRTPHGRGTPAGELPPPPPAPSFALTGPTTAVAGVSQNYTLTGSNLVPGQNYVGSLVSGDPGMVDTPSEVTLTSVSPAAVVGVLFAAVGAQTLKGLMASGAESNQLTVTVSDPPSPPPPPPAPTLATLSGSNSATEDVAHASVVTLDAPADQVYTVTWIRSNGGTGPATSTIGIGQTATSGATDTWADPGSETVDFTISPSLTRAGRPLAVTVGAAGSFAWSIPADAVLSTGRNTTTELATGVQAGSLCYISPDPLPDQTPLLDGSTFKLVGGNGVPTVNNDVPGSQLSAVAEQSHRATAGWRIEVLEAPLCVMNHIRAGSIIGTYGHGQAETRIWYAIQDLARDGDIFEISPGCIAPNTSVKPSSYLEGAMLKINQSITLRGMPGRGRYKLLPDSVSSADMAGLSAIVILGPQDIAGTDWDYNPGNRRKTVVIEDLDLSAWGTGGGDNGIKIRAGTEAGDGSFTHMLASFTLRNFKIGKRPYEPGGSGVNGASEIMQILDGHVYDCGGGVGAADGQDHNLYVSAKTFTMLGARSSRSRGATALGWWEGGVDMDGQLLKVSAVDALIEACVFDADPWYGDNSAHLQFKAGGNAVVRGCVLVGSVHTQNEGQGMVVMYREMNVGGTTPNFESWAGMNGNSLLFERNTIVNHYGKPIVYFFPSGNANYMGPGTGVNQIASVTVRDNIGIVAATPTVDAPFTSAKWIKNDPTGGPAWSVNNSEMPYTREEVGFSEDQRRLKSYRRTAGPIAASGTLAFNEFVYPHGYRARNDAYRGA